VLVLGNLSREKGLRVVAACAADAKARGLPLTFRVLGSTTEPVAQSPEVPLSIVGQYEEAALPTLLAAEKPDVIFFPAQVPETYSYTLSVALATGRADRRIVARRACRSASPVTLALATCAGTRAPRNGTRR
jgi:hypothetical protein